jgi:hypothetical protein
VSSLTAKESGLDDFVHTMLWRQIIHTVYQLRVMPRINPKPSGILPNLFRDFVVCHCRSENPVNSPLWKLDTER